jgi:hypothetical protein
MEPKRFGKNKWNNKVPYVQSLGSLLEDKGSSKFRKNGKFQLGPSLPKTIEIVEHNPKFSNLLTKMKTIHNKKNQDYASDSNPYSNFEFAATYAQIPLYKVYLVLEGIKTARLHELLGKGKIPNNESIDDTWLDKATYAAIAASNLMNLQDERNDKRNEEIEFKSTPKDSDEV